MPPTRRNGASPNGSGAAADHRCAAAAAARELAREPRAALGADMSVAIVVVDNASGEVLARVASPDYFDERRAGQVDLTRAVRSPGSALKPFIYGLGFEDGLIHPETLIEDRPIRYGGYAPENFDLTFQGTVTVRRALQLSLNVPAVAVLEEVGPSRLIARLAEAGAPLVLPRARSAGARARAWRHRRAGSSTSPCSMRGSRGRAPWRRSSSGSAPRRCRRKRLLEPVAAWYVANVLHRHAAARERGRRAHRLQDRHELRLSRRLGDRLRRQAHHRRVGRPARRRAGRGPRRAASLPPRSCSMPSPGWASRWQPLPPPPQGRAGRDHRQAAAAAAALRLPRQRAARP